MRTKSAVSVESILLVGSEVGQPDLCAGFFKGKLIKQMWKFG